jgi:cell division protein FtsW (lipid II flippase)
MLVVWAVTALSYVAIIWSADLKGYAPSRWVAARDLALLIPMLAAFVWLVRRERLRGETLLFSLAILLFFFGSVAQYRLFSDPEYGSRGSERSRARELKSRTVKLRNVSTGYDEEKKAFLFGAPEAVPEKPAVNVANRQITFGDVLTSVNTYIPVMAVLALCIAFRVFTNDAILLWLQKHSLLIGLASLVPFGIAVVLFSEEGKFLGQTTPWEPVKIVFLVTFAGALTESYRRLVRTRWGLPPVRYVLPIVAVAAMPVLPFFALSDFGQMLVFFGVYFTLYSVAVRKRIQLLYGVLLLVVIFGAFYVTSDLKTGFGLPARVYLRFHMWTNTWDPPPPDTWWWKPDYERYLRSQRLTVDPADTGEAEKLNAEAWSDRTLQLSQGLFGTHEGGVFGEGHGLGFPETVPVSDSDFIYAAIAEETGLLGCIALLLTIGAFVTAGIKVALTSTDMFTKLLATGLTTFVGFQGLVNIGGVLRLLPMTGITLPFVSHGGWSLITSFAMLGALLAISHRNATASPPLET